MNSADNPNPEVYSAKASLLTDEELAKRRQEERDVAVEDPIDVLEGTGV